MGHDSSWQGSTESVTNESLDSTTISRFSDNSVDFSDALIIERLKERITRLEVVNTFFLLCLFFSSSFVKIWFLGFFKLNCAVVCKIYSGELFLKGEFFPCTIWTSVTLWNTVKCLWMLKIFSLTIIMYSKIYISLVKCSDYSLHALFFVGLLEIRMRMLIHCVALFFCAVWSRFFNRANIYDNFSFFCFVGKNRHEEREYNVKIETLFSWETSRISTITTRTNQTSLRQIHVGSTRKTQYLQGNWSMRARHAFQWIVVEDGVIFTAERTCSKTIGRQVMLLREGVSCLLTERVCKTF